jgi:hypothetical protein
MFGFGKKKEVMTVKQLGAAFSGYILAKNFTKEEEFLYEKYRQNYFQNVSQNIFFREWILFEAWVLSITFSDYFKDSSLGSDSYQHFISSLKRITVDDSLFASMNEADSMFASHYQDYEDEMRANKEPNYLYWVSKRFCGYLGNDREPEAILYHSAIIPGILKNNAQALTMVLEKSELISK